MTALPGFAAALAAAGLMGFAIQRGATCLVVAVEEVLAQRRATRLLALLEGGAWVAAGLLIVQAAGGLRMPPSPYPATGWTALGGALLGLGAWVNRGCLFGTVARLGNGEWAYLATPAGFFLGCLGFGLVLPPPPPSALGEGSPVLSAPGWVAVAGLLLLAWRIAVHLRRRQWSPHLATLVIAATFLVTLLLVGSWSYADVLAEAARGMSREVAARLLLLLALLSGAVLGGRLAGRAGLPPRLSDLLRCLAGGGIMAGGGMLVPGQNDGLILLGVPLLWLHAWLGVLAMCGAIALARSLARWSTTG